MTQAVSTNGDGKAPTVAELREQLRVMRYTRLIKQETVTKRLIESFDCFGTVGENWGDFVDMRAAGRPDPQYGDTITWQWAVNPQQRKRGAPYVAYRNMEDLRQIWGLSREIADRNPFVVGALGGLEAYVIHTGYTYRAVARKGVDEKKAADYVALAQMELDAFDNDSVWPELESELFHKSRVEGEATLRHFSDDDAEYLQVRLVEPEQIIPPKTLPDGETQEEWEFGVHCDPKDTQRVLGFGISYEPTHDDWEEVSADEIEFFKLNAGRNVRRGLTDFFCCGEVAEDLKKLMRNMRQGAAVLAAIAWWEKYKTAAPQEVEKAHQDLATFSKTVRNPDGSQRVRNYRSMEPGSVVSTDADRDVSPAPLASNTPYFAQIVTLARQSLCIRWNAPESFLGDASNGAYASLAVAESPFIRRCEKEQQFYARRFRRTKIRALKHAIKRGRLAEETLQYVDVHVEPPNPVTRDRLQQTQINKIRNEAGVLSPQTWAQEDGLDFEEEWNEIKTAEGMGWTRPAAGAAGLAGLAGMPGLGAAAPGMFRESQRRRGDRADPFAWLREGGL